MTSRSAPAACSRGSPHEGAEVTLAIVSIPNNTEQRKAEAQAAADVLDAELFILYEDKPCRVEDIPMHELVRRFDSIVGDVRPDLVITHSANDLHWDHGLVNRATVSALRRTPCDLLAYLSSPEMNAQARSIGNCFADISAYVDDEARGDRLPQVAAAQARPRDRRATSRARWAASAATTTPRRTKFCASGFEN